MFICRWRRRRVSDAFPPCFLPFDAVRLTFLPVVLFRLGAEWFKTLPAEPLAKGRVMMLGGWEYAEIWKVAGRKLERVWRGER